MENSWLIIPQLFQEPLQLVNEGEYLAEMLVNASGKNIEFQADNAKGSIVLVIDATISNEEGYVLDVKYDNIRITGKNGKGIFYGIQTLRQLLPAAVEKGAVAELTIPAVTIEDSPEFGYRGMHLDVARHFFPVSFVKKYIDILAMHKMNTFHWHLTEDQGWRLR